MEHHALVQLALRMGATKATVIPQEKIVLSSEFRKICEGNGCGMYNKTWMCSRNKHLWNTFSILLNLQNICFNFVIHLIVFTSNLLIHCHNSFNSTKINYHNIFLNSLN